MGSSAKSTASEDNTAKMDAGSWRQALFKRVVAQQKPHKTNSSRRKSKEDLRDLWKKSIRQAVLLVRMDKENARIQGKSLFKSCLYCHFLTYYYFIAQQEENAVKRIKLEYDEIKSIVAEGSLEVWDLITNKESRATLKTDTTLLFAAIRQGTPFICL